MKSYAYVPLFLAGAAMAWMPADRDLAAFNMTARYEQLGKRYAPSLPSGVTKIRGVNLGGWLISEPWMMCDEWASMGCADANNCNSNSQASEFDCMRNVYGNDHDAGTAAFEKHWSSWITPDTVQSIHDVGLNTIRIPIGYWSYTDIVDKSSEPFADGDRLLPYLDAVVQKAADLGIYVIIDFHGAPGGQQQDPFTGQNNAPAGFFNDYNYGRAEKWMSWMTNRIHTNSAYSTVGMIEVLNEPVSNHDANNRYPAPGEDTLTTTYYPGALKAVRDAENSLNVPSEKRLHVQFMDNMWGAGNPRDSSDVQNDSAVAFDDHNYIGFRGDIDTGNQDDLMRIACQDNRAAQGEDFKITGEWSMTSNVDPSDGDFFRRWFTAQQQLYEAAASNGNPAMQGWVYWTWKTQLNDPRWTYSDATSLGYIPTDAQGLEQNVYTDVCAQWGRK